MTDDFKIEGVVVNDAEERRVQNFNHSDYVNLPKGWFRGKTARLRRTWDFLNKEFVITITEVKDDG